MLRFAANLTMLYPELPFLDRFEAAARDGFKAVEILFPYAWPAQELAARLKDNGLELALFNGTPPADEFERGVAGLPGRKADFMHGFGTSLAYAETLECTRLHLMSGLVPPNASHGEIAAMRSTLVANLRWAAAQAGKQGLRLCIEPINTRDIPGYFLNRQDEAHAIVDEVDSDFVKVQMDLYHCQIVEGDVTAKLRRYLPTGNVAHMQIAGVPARNEPDAGELDYRYVLDVVDELGYDGWIGCEYRPRLGNVPGGTSVGLDWLRALGALQTPGA
ncbi:hydroxypyruvate isomerase family protein [soil metagenome]